MFNWSVRLRASVGTPMRVPAVNVESTVQKAPRVVLYPNQGLVVLGAYEINKLRRPFQVSFYEWTSVSGIPLPPNKPKGPRYDRMKLAREYQSILD